MTASRADRRPSPAAHPVHPHSLGKSVAADDAFETDQHMPFKAIIFLIFRGAIAESCFTLKTTTAGCSSILTDRHRKAVNQVDRILQRP